jgi:hypothetical protein
VAQENDAGWGRRSPPGPRPIRSSARQRKTARRGTPLRPTPGRAPPVRSDPNGGHRRGDGQAARLPLPAWRSHQGVAHYVQWVFPVSSTSWTTEHPRLTPLSATDFVQCVIDGGFGAPGSSAAGRRALGGRRPTPSGGGAHAGRRPLMDRGPGRRPAGGTGGSILGVCASASSVSEHGRLVRLRPAGLRGVPGRTRGAMDGPSSSFPVIPSSSTPLARPASSTTTTRDDGTPSSRSATSRPQPSGTSSESWGKNIRPLLGCSLGRA